MKKWYSLVAGMGVYTALVLQAKEPPLTPPASTAHCGESGPAVGNQAGEVRVLDETIGLKVVWCPPGSFQMGSPSSNPEARDVELPQSTVTLTRGYWCGQTEVTQQQWDAVMPEAPWENFMVRTGPSVPATFVTWEQGREFCRRLTDREREAGQIGSHEAFRLPTEAEWEYACRGGTKSTYFFGEDVARATDYAWTRENTEGAGEDYCHDVALKKPNPWGLYDMPGNVREWCEDCFSEHPPTGRDPLIVNSDPRRLVRGACYAATATAMRSSQRYFWAADVTPGTGHDLGLRVVLSRIRD